MCEPYNDSLFNLANRLTIIKSMFITFEGIEGSGKSTQISRLAAWLTAQFNQKPIVTREPGGCAIADKIRGILLDVANSDMNEQAELLLYAAARAQHVAQIIRPALNNGQIVLCDRYSDATLAYQGFGRGLPRPLIEEINQLATLGTKPDLTLLLDFDPEIGLSRAIQRNSTATGPNENRFEQENLDFHRRIRDGYLSLAAEQSRFCIIDAAGDADSVAARIQAAVAMKLGHGHN
jgi:dTMP kinase